MLLSSKSYAFTQRITNENQVRAAFAMNNKIYVSFKDDSLGIFNAETLNRSTAFIKTPIVIRKFYKINDTYLLLSYGTTIHIMDTRTDKYVYTGKLQTCKGLIFDIDKTGRALSEYVFAIGSRTEEYEKHSQQGIRFVNIIMNNYNQFMIHENTVEKYFDEYNAFCVESINQNIIAACFNQLQHIQIINRSTGQIDSIENTSGDSEFSTLQKVIDFDIEKRPYLLCKNQSGIMLISIANRSCIMILQLPFMGIYCADQSLLQIKEEMKQQLKDDNEDSCDKMDCDCENDNNDDEIISNNSLYKIISIGYSNETAERIIVEMTYSY